MKKKKTSGQDSHKSKNQKIYLKHKYHGIVGMKPAIKLCVNNDFRFSYERYNPLPFGPDNDIIGFQFDHAPHKQDSLMTVEDPNPTLIGQIGVHCFHTDKSNIRNGGIEARTLVYRRILGISVTIRLWLSRIELGRELRTLIIRR